MLCINSSDYTHCYNQVANIIHQEMAIKWEL
jgi:hypothetical protein